LLLFYISVGSSVQGVRDYGLIQKGPSLLADIEMGHIGSYYQKSGGRMGKIAVRFLQWKFKDQKDLKEEFCGNSTSSELVKLGFKIQSKNGMC
jgi:hypothetical protein